MLAEIRQQLHISVDLLSELSIDRYYVLVAYILGPLFGIINAYGGNYVEKPSCGTVIAVAVAVGRSVLCDEPCHVN